MWYSIPKFGGYMKNYLINKEEQGNFILNYEINSDGTMTINYTNGIMVVEEYSKETESNAVSHISGFKYIKNVL